MTPNEKTSSTEALATLPSASSDTYTKAEPGEGRLFTFLHTSLDADSDKTFFRVLTTDDLRNLKALNHAWKNSKKLDWALSGAGNQYVKDHCHFPSPDGRGPCEHAQTTRRADLQWCEAHPAVSRMPTLVMCPNRVCELAPGTTLRGRSGPMCQLCKMNLPLQDHMY